MKKILLASLAVGAMMTVAAPADARQGCGIGGHRGPWGGCRPNRWGPPPGGGWVVGTYYPHRGYWYNNRFWWHRYGGPGAWRYR